MTFAFCNQAGEDIDHLFKSCDLVKTAWAMVDTLCPSPNDLNCSFVDCIDQIWNKKMWYDKLFYKPLETIFIIAWTIRNYRSDVIFRNYPCNPAHVLKSATRTFRPTI